MSNIEELQRRITAAMDRVAQGLEQMGPASAAGDEADTLKAALDEEKTVNAQLTERVKVLKERHDTDLREMKAQGEAAAARLSQLDTDLSRLRQVNAQLLDACEALRRANEEGVGEAHLVNKAMLAELEALRAARAVDVAEANSILGAMAPLLAAHDAAAATDTADTTEETA